MIRVGEIGFLLLLICCLVCFPLFFRMFDFVLFCITVCPFKFCNHLEEEAKAGCFAFIVLL